MSGPRQFEDTAAVREAVPLYIGLFAPSGGGKTYSALMLATGIQRVTGGEIGFIDTEARRALHYAWDEEKKTGFRFRHIDMKPPFGSLDYIDAIQYAIDRGMKIIITDSMSHEHEGPGGLLDQMETFLDERAGNDYQKRDRLLMASLIKPKGNRRRLINCMVQWGRAGVVFIFCFRAKDSTKPIKRDGKTEIVKQGFMPICGEELFFEMTASCFLPPRSNGTPMWKSEYAGETLAMKLPMQFVSILNDGGPLTVDKGEKLALWARGGVKLAITPEIQKENEANGEAAAQRGGEALKTWWTGIDPSEKKRLKPKLDAEWKAMAATFDAAPATPPPAETPRSEPSDVAAIETLLLDLNLTETYAINLAEEQGARVRSTTTLSTLPPEAAKLLLEELQRIKERNAAK